MPRTPTRTSTRATLRGLAAAYRRLDLRLLAGGFLLTLAVIAAATHSLGSNPLPVAVVLAASAVALDLAVRFPATAATVLTVAACSIAATPFAALYAVAATGTNADPVAASLTLTATLTLTGLLAHRTSRGRPWVTTLIVGLAVMFVGPLLLLINRWAGFAWVWLIMVVVLFLRAGGTGWAIATIRRLFTHHHTPTTTAVVGNPQAATATATLLAGLPDTYTLLIGKTHDTGTMCPHVVVGPTGIFCIDSATAPGTVTDHPTKGLSHRRVDVPGLLHATATRTTWLTDHAHLKTPATPVLVLHDATLPVDPARVALTPADQLDDDSATADEALMVTLTTADTLLTAITGPARTNTITTTQPALSARQVARIVQRITRALANQNTDTGTDAA